MPPTNRKGKELFKLGTSIDQRKIEFVKHAKSLTTEREEVNFLFLYYFKNFGAIRLVNQKLWIRILICVSIFCHIWHKEYW